MLQGHVKNWVCYISTTTRSIAVKLGMKVTYYENLLPIMSHNTLNKWSRDKLKIYYLYYHNVYDEETDQGGYIQ